MSLKRIDSVFECKIRQSYAAPFPPPVTATPPPHHVFNPLPHCCLQKQKHLDGRGRLVTRKYPMEDLLVEEEERRLLQALVQAQALAGKGEEGQAAAAAAGTMPSEGTQQQSQVALTQGDSQGSSILSSLPPDSQALLAGSGGAGSVVLTAGGLILRPPKPVGIPVEQAFGCERPLQLCFEGVYEPPTDGRLLAAQREAADVDGAESAGVVVPAKRKETVVVKQGVGDVLEVDAFCHEYGKSMRSANVSGESHQGLLEVDLV